MFLFEEFVSEGDMMMYKYEYLKSRTRKQNWVEGGRFDAGVADMMCTCS